MLEHARRRVPGAPLVEGEIEDLPFPDAGFDVVTGFNSFQYAARHRQACLSLLRGLPILRHEAGAAGCAHRRRPRGRIELREDRGDVMGDRAL